MHAYYSASPEARTAYIGGLRALADFLEVNGEVPVPTFGTTINLHMTGDDDLQRIEIERLGRLFRVDVSYGTHWVATRKFGPIAFEAAAIPTACKQEHEARTSYESVVVLDDGQAA